MNIKRAFLTAAAVLMVPGFAMAQSTVTFSTAIDPTEAGAPDVTVSCNGGLPLTQTAPIGTTFTVTEINVGDVCTVMSDDLDSDWMAHGYSCAGDVGADPCEYTMVDGTDNFDTLVVAVPVPFEYTANLMWEISEDADPGVEDGAMLVATCENIYVGVHGPNGDFTTTTATVAGDMNTSVAIEALPDPAGSTICYAQLMGVGSAVEVMSGCGSETI